MKKTKDKQLCNQINIITRNFVSYGGVPYSLLNLFSGLKDYPININLLVCEKIDEQFLANLPNNVKLIVPRKKNLIYQIIYIFYKLPFALTFCTCFRTYVISKLSIKLYLHTIFWFRGYNILNTHFKKAFFSITNTMVPISNSFFTAKGNELEEFKILYNGTNLELLKNFNKNKDLGTLLKLLYNKKKQNYIIIGAIGGWSELKNHKTLIHAINALAKCGIKIFCIVIGEKSKLTSIIENNIPKDTKVNFLFVDKMDGATNLIECFDIFVHTCKAEGFGNVIIEAMASKKIIVAANAGAIPELIDNKVNGVLYYPADDVNKLNEALQYVMEINEYEKELLRQNAYNTYFDKFTHHKYAKYFYELTLNAKRKK